MNDGVTIGLDLAKNVFQVHGVGDGGAGMISKRLRRRQVVPFFKTLPSCVIGVEACATSHPWARWPMARPIASQRRPMGI